MEQESEEEEESEEESDEGGAGEGGGGGAGGLDDGLCHAQREACEGCTLQRAAWIARLHRLVRTVTDCKDSEDCLLDR